jgi:thiol-disulfide isomerase/thioredoxin
MFKRFFVALAVALSLNAASAQAGQGSGLAPLFGANDWINGMPNAQSLAGKVVIVDVFTFNCYNCKNVTPNLRALNKSRSPEVAIVGVHAPETKYESVRSNIVDQLKAQGIVWPVAVDNDFAVWKAYGIEYWPTQLIFDRHGKLRATVIGDSQDALVNSTVNKLLAEK